MNNMPHKLSKAVIITRPDGTETEYPSQSLAARATGIVQTTVSMMCRGKRADFNGIKARFAASVPAAEIPPEQQPTADEQQDQHPV